VLPTLSFNNTPTTPLPGFTPLGTSVVPVNTASFGDGCNNLAWVADATYPDNSEIKPGKDFEKKWTVKNTGTCAWDEGYKLVFVGGDRALDPTSFEFENKDDFVAPGETADIGVDLTSPNQEGNYGGTWRMQSDQGVYFGQYLTILIVVKK
jgi:hypothetical protein